MSITLTAIHRYPVKSTRGQSLSTALIEPWGLAGDRRWMLADETGETVTAREHPRLLLITAQLTADGLLLRADGREPLFVPTPSDGSTMVSVHHKAPFAASFAGTAAAQWLSEYLDTPVRLVHTDDPTRRHLNPRFSRPDDCASFADGYPLLLTTEDSLTRLNDWIAAGPLAHEGPLPMTRFRPNVVVSGAPAFAEDTWRLIRIGAAVFRAPKGCDRCVMTTTDPDTATRGKEPIATLARHRRWDGATWFGMNLIPDTPATTITVGDDVEILQCEASDGPPR